MAPSTSRNGATMNAMDQGAALWGHHWCFQSGLVSCIESKCENLHGGISCWYFAWWNSNFCTCRYREIEEPQNATFTFTFASLLHRSTPQHLSLLKLHNGRKEHWADGTNFSGHYVWMAQDFEGHAGYHGDIFFM